MKTKFKKIVSICLILVMVCSITVSVGFNSSAAENEFEYSLDEGKTYATITGYTGNDDKALIPEQIDGYPVRYIGEYSFMMNSDITEVVIPSSVKAIDRYAFFMCDKLSNVTFDEGLKYIGTAAFNGCESLTSVLIPDTVLYIDDYAFFGDTQMTSFTLGKRVKYIGENAIGMYSDMWQQSSDWSETNWPLYDKFNAYVKNLRISGYSNTAADDYFTSEKGEKAEFSYNSLGAANVNEVGDVNGDGIINIKDATVTQKIAAEIISGDKYDIFVADVDDDNEITGQDTTAIQKYIVGFDVTLGGTAYEIPENSSNPDDYDLPTLKFTDINDSDKKQKNTISEIIKINSKSVTSTAKVVFENFEGMDPSVESYVNLKLQGSSSINYNKKNFTIKLFKDAAESQKNKMTVVDSWGKENKYVIKANYIDHSHARNIVSAKLWGDIVRSRKNIDPNLENLVNGGAIDGFPIKVYINGEYQGLYTFNIPKDDWMLGMDSDYGNQAILCGEVHSGSSAFLAPFNDQDWSVEYVPNEDDYSWIAPTFDPFYEFLNSKSITTEELRENFSKYTDVEACIDYMLFVHIICAMDCLDKNMLWVTFDGGEKWLPSAYDLDTTYGIHWDGQYFYDDDEMLDFSKRSPSMLWIRLKQAFPNEINERYAELREGALSLENIISRFEDFTDVIPNALYKLDNERTNVNGDWYSIPQNDCSNVNQIVTYMANRYKYLDSVYGYEAK